MTDKVVKTLSAFHNRVARQISGLTTKFLEDEDRWDYRPVVDASTGAVLHDIKHVVIL